MVLATMRNGCVFLRLSSKFLPCCHQICGDTQLKFDFFSGRPCAARLRSLSGHLSKTSAAWLLVLLAPFGCWVSGLGTHGLRVTNDSVVYYSAAERFYETGSILDASGNPLTTWAPFYPVAIASVSFLVPSTELNTVTLTNRHGAFVISVFVLHAALLVNLISLLVSIGLFFSLLRRFAVPLGYRTLATLTVFLHPGMVNAFQMAWSEGLYIALTLLLLWLACLERNGYWKCLLLGALAGCAFLTRYIGMAALPVALAAQWPSRAAGGRGIKQLGVTLLAGLMPIGGWLLRNHSIDGTWMGVRIPESVSFLTVVREAILSFDLLLFSGLMRWIMVIPEPLDILLVLLIPLSIVVVLRLAFQSGAHIRRVLWLTAVLVVSYMLALFYSRMTTHIDPLFAFRLRYMIPMLPFFLIFITLVLAHGKISLDSMPKRIAAWAFFAVCLITEVTV
jgi:hypothetical protein